MPKNRLQEFVAAAHARVEAGFYASNHNLPQHGSFKEATQGGIIAEYKPRSPSEGRILVGDPARLLEAYKKADAISVLTDCDYFDGHPDMLVAAHATGRPTLMKDFIVNQAQLDCAKACGASAVLLIERVFEAPEERESLVAAAHERGLEVLLEVFNDADWLRAQHSKAELIGVNARDLDTLDVDAEGALQLLNTISAERAVLALSGISHRRHRRRAMQQGAHAILVGTHLVKSPNPGMWLTALRRPLAKVCGITSTADLDIARGADLVGFVVGSESPRSIGAVKAQQLADEARLRGQSPVLVTRHDDDYEVREWCRVVKPDWVQCHGFEPTPEWAYSLGAIPTRVMGVNDATWPGLLVDTGTGGTGEVHDWSKSAKLVEGHRGLTLVAGGLAAANASEALATTGAWGADASSRLEASPGQKDAAATHAFISKVQETQ